MISRSYTWIDEDQEHSDQECARAAALAKKWSALMTEQENRSFSRSYDSENWTGPEPCEDCNACAAGEYDNCEYLRSIELARQEKEAELSLEIELIEDKLAAIGARMMRPYEHWNEDERYMQYMESRYDY